jgi:hypothetical protein
MVCNFLIVRSHAQHGIGYLILETDTMGYYLVLQIDAGLQ